MRTQYFFSTAVVAAVLMMASPNATGAGNTDSSGSFSFRLESGGVPLHTWYKNGYSYVEGQAGQNYAIRVFNRTGQRVEAVVTVDGRSVISGQEGNYRDQRGYVISPYSSVLIEGFRTSFTNVAGFYFTDIGDSYAARMGNAANVGVIGVAVFKEKERRPIPRPRIATPHKRGPGTGYGSTAPKSSASKSEGCATYDDAESQGIGTGYGSEQYSPATGTTFERRSRRPDSRLAIYYDDREGLIARGVIRAYRPPVRQKPRPQPFPMNNDPQFAPPPPAYYWE